jgi:hypothetical protein
VGAFGGPGGDALGAPVPGAIGAATPGGAARLGKVAPQLLHSTASGMFDA